MEIHLIAPAIGARVLEDRAGRSAAGVVRDASLEVRKPTMLGFVPTAAE
ncbi:hypothetical protein WMF18_19170 [Sorangium sp. So ce315]